MNLQTSAEAEPERRTRSKLEPHREAIFTLRRKHWTYRQIAKSLNERGIHWQGFDLDGDNKTLSRLFPRRTKLIPLNGQAEDLDELVSILRKTTVTPVTLVDPRAHLDGQVMKALRATHFFDIAKA